MWTSSKERDDERERNILFLLNFTILIIYVYKKMGPLKICGHVREITSQSLIADPAISSRFSQHAFKVSLSNEFSSL